jgi:hypothetical protein
MQGRRDDGRAAKIDTFADGFTHAMSVAVRRSAKAGQPDKVYVATRREIVILTDADGDLKADDRRRRGQSLSLPAGRQAAHAMGHRFLESARELL